MFPRLPAVLEIIVSTSLLYFQQAQCSDFLRQSIFWSPRALTPVSARGLGGGADAGSSLSGVGPPVCIVNPRRLWTYTSCLKESTETPTTSQASWPVCIPSVVNHFSQTLTVGLLMAERDVGSARRRRERQLRSFLRHEWMTVRMELAAALHHSAFKSAGPETNDALRSQKTVNSREEVVFFDEYTAGWRPPCLGPGPQERVPQRTVEPMLETFVSVPSLDVPVLQMVDQPVDILQILDVPLPEQVIDVPKISLDSVPQRTMLPEPQLVEQ